MHLEILVEGQSERTALEPLLVKILGSYGHPHTWRIHKHRGIGKIPTNPLDRPNSKDPTLLHNLPAKLRAYGKSLTRDEAVVVLVDLDDRKDCVTFKKEMINLLEYCDPAPRYLFRIAIEELEAWYLGDQTALISAYPNADINALAQYIQDSQCGTWEVLADATYPGRFESLKKQGNQRCLEQKRIWARDIAPKINIETNMSPSFQCFRDGLIRLTQS